MQHSFETEIKKNKLKSTTQNYSKLIETKTHHFDFS